MFGRKKQEESPQPLTPEDKDGISSELAEIESQLAEINASITRSFQQKMAGEMSDGDYNRYVDTLSMRCNLLAKRKERLLVQMDAINAWLASIALNDTKK